MPIPRESRIKQAEKEYQARWEYVAQRSQISWLTRHAFWQEFDQTYFPRARYLDLEVECSASLEELRARIRMSPVFCPPEGDLPGPFERWYGKTNGHLFLLTHFYHPTYPKLTSIAVEPKDDIATIVLAAMKHLLALDPYSES